MLKYSYNRHEEIVKNFPTKDTKKYVTFSLKQAWGNMQMKKGGGVPPILLLLFVCFLLVYEGCMGIRYFCKSSFVR